MRNPRLLIPAVLALVVIAALVVAGLSRTFVRSYTLDVPNISIAGQLSPGKRLCEGPIPVRGGSFQQVQVFGIGTAPSARAQVRVSAAGSGQALGTGTVTATPVAGVFTATFPRPISGVAPVRVCVVGEHGTFAIQGSTAYDPSIKMGKTASNFSLSLGNRRSVLAALGTAFSHASALKFSWVGAWTFWVLTAALLGCFGLGVLAVVRAATEDADATRD